MGRQDILGGMISWVGKISGLGRKISWVGKISCLGGKISWVGKTFCLIGKISCLLVGLGLGTHEKKTRGRVSRSSPTFSGKISSLGRMIIDIVC